MLGQLELQARELRDMFESSDVILCYDNNSALSCLYQPKGFTVAFLLPISEHHQVKRQVARSWGSNVCGS